MTCEDCGSAVTSASGEPRCAACANEAAMYAAYARSIEVPPMWEAIAARVQRDARRRRITFRTFAIAAAFAAAVVAMVAMRLWNFSGAAPRNEAPLTVAAAHYREAIRKLEPKAGRATRLLPQLTAAIEAAERAAAHSPDDPVAVTRVVAAYDAKLQLLRAAAYD